MFQLSKSSLDSAHIVWNMYYSALNIMDKSSSYINMEVI